MMPPLAPTKPNVPGLLADARHRLGDGVHRVVVAGAAEERQPAGQREAARVVGSELEAVADVEDRGREAAVQVDGGEVARLDAGHLERMPGGHDRRPGSRQVGPLHQRALAQVGVAVQEHPAVFGHAQPLRRRHRHQQHGGALVDLLPGDDVTGVGVGDRAVRRGRGDQFRRAALDRGGRVRVGRRHPGERLEQRAHGGGVLRPGSA